MMGSTLPANVTALLHFGDHDGPPQRGLPVRDASRGGERQYHRRLCLLIIIRCGASWKTADAERRGA